MIAFKVMNSVQIALHAKQAGIYLSIDWNAPRLKV